MIASVNAGNAVQIGRHTIKNAVQPQQTDSKAATFQHYGISDYKDKQLSPMQQSIVKLQDQIANLKNNDRLNNDTKEEMLANLNNQLDDMMKSLNDPQQKEAESPLVAARKKGNEQNASSNEMSSLYHMGAQLDQAKSLGTIKAKIENQTQLEKSELDNAANHPIEALRLKDENIIAKRQEKIENMESASQNLGSMMAEQMKPVVQPALPKTPITGKAEEKEPAEKESTQTNEAAEKSNLEKSADSAE